MVSMCGCMFHKIYLWMHTFTSILKTPDQPCQQHYGQLAKVKGQWPQQWLWGKVILLFACIYMYYISGCQGITHAQWPFTVVWHVPSPLRPEPSCQCMLAWIYNMHIVVISTNAVSALCGGRNQTNWSTEYFWKSSNEPKVYYLNNTYRLWYVCSSSTYCVLQ